MPNHTPESIIELLEDRLLGSRQRIQSLCKLLYSADNWEDKLRLSVKIATHEGIVSSLEDIIKDIKNG